MPRERTNYFIRFLIAFWLLELSEHFFLGLKQNLLSLSPSGSNPVLWANLFPLFPYMPIDFKIVILSSSLIFRVKNQTKIKQNPYSFNSFSHDMVFRCFTILLSSLCMYTVWLTGPLQYISGTENNLGSATHRIITSCDVNAIFLSYNLEGKDRVSFSSHITS